MYFIIANPAAQSGQQDNRLLKQLEAALRERQQPYFTCFNARPDYVKKFIKSMDRGGEINLVALGGDGTINNVINAIEDFSRVYFAFLPIGSSNDLARGLGIKDIHKDKTQAENIKKIAAGKVVRRIDLGLLTDERTGLSRRFAVSCGLGFDAAVCHEVNKSKFKNFFNAFNQGKLTYGAIALRELATIPKTQAMIFLDGQQAIHINRLIFAACMNTPYEGGGFKFAPDASAENGVLNLAAIGDLSLAQILPKFPAAYLGKYYHFKGVHHSPFTKIQIKLDHPLWVHTDGEVARKSSAVSVKCLPRVLKMLI